MNANEVEYLGEKELVTIIPTFNSGVIHLISGDVGQFRASLPVKVPLWLAVHLKQQQKCKFQQPEWMEIEKLEKVKEDEKNSKTFTKVPEHYMVETKLILANAAEDIPRADEVRTLVKDIWDIRMSKLRSSVDDIVRNGGCYAAVDHLTLMEINTIRPLLPHALEQAYRIKQVFVGGENSSRFDTYDGVHDQDIRHKENLIQPPHRPAKSTVVDFKQINFSTKTKKSTYFRTREVNLFNAQPCEL